MYLQLSQQLGKQLPAVAGRLSFLTWAASRCCCGHRPHTLCSLFRSSRLGFVFALERSARARKSCFLRCYLCHGNWAPGLANGVLFTQPCRWRWKLMNELSPAWPNLCPHILQNKATNAKDLGSPQFIRKSHFELLSSSANKAWVWDSISWGTN